MSDDGWVVTPKEAPAELAEGYKAPEFIPIAEVIAEYTGLSEERLEELGGVPDPISPTSLRTDTDEWLRIMHRMSDSDRAAVEKVLGIAADVMP